MIWRSVIWSDICQQFQTLCHDSELTAPWSYQHSLMEITYDCCVVLSLSFRPCSQCSSFFLFQHCATGRQAQNRAETDFECFRNYRAEEMKPGSLLLASFLIVKDNNRWLPIEKILDLTWSELFRKAVLDVGEYSDRFIPSKPVFSFQSSNRDRSSLPSSISQW